MAHDTRELLATPLEHNLSYFFRFFFTLASNFSSGGNLFDTLWIGLREKL